MKHVLAATLSMQHTDFLRLENKLLNIHTKVYNAQFS